MNENKEVEFFTGKDDTDSYEPGWYFWDETWTEATGPFDTEHEATEALKKYAETL